MARQNGWFAKKKDKGDIVHEDEDGYLWCLGRVDDVVHLRQDRVFELRMVADPGIQSAYPLHRRIEASEEFIGDTGGQFRAVTPGNAVFMNDHDAAGFRDRGLDGGPIVRRERTKVDNFDAVIGILALDLNGGLQALLHQRAIGDDG